MILQPFNFFLLAEQLHEQRSPTYYTIELPLSTHPHTTRQGLGIEAGLGKVQ